jgi:hypothetical protein
MVSYRGPGSDEAPGQRPTYTRPRGGSAALTGEDRRSVRVALAAALLRHGRDPIRVAETTEVPLALVEFLAEHPRAARRPDRPETTDDRGPSLTPPTGPVWQVADTSRPWATPPTPDPNRSMAWWPLRTLAPLLMNLGLALYCLSCHHPVLGVISLLAAAPLLVLSLLIRPR